MRDLPHRSRCAAAQAHAIPAAGTGGLDPEALRDIDRLVAAHRRATEAEEEAALARAEVEGEIIAVLAVGERQQDQAQRLRHQIEDAQGRPRRS